MIIVEHYVNKGEEAMTRGKKRMFIVSAAFVLGIGVLTPSYASAAMGQTESQVQIGQLIKGTVVENWTNEIVIKGEDGERYHVGLHHFSDEAIQSMNISVGATLEIEGELLESFADLYDFSYFVKSLPPGITKDDIKELELLYNEAMVLEKEGSWEKAGEFWTKINEITRPYYLANWDPEPFDVYISMFDYSFTNDDLLQLEQLYTDWISLAKSGAEEQSNQKMNQFFEMVGSYYVEPTFEEYIADLDLSLSEVDYPVIKQLYEDAHQASRDGNDQLASDNWAAFDLAMRPYYRAINPMPPFEEQMAYYDFEVSEEDHAKLQAIYTGILEFEQNGKYEQADRQWESFYAILEPYFAINISIPFRASQVIVNGETFHR